MAVDKLVSELVAIIERRIANDRLVLPLMPVLAGKCQVMIRDAELPIKQASLTIERDPILAAQVMRIAATLSYGGSSRSVEQAVSRLGVPKLRSFLNEVSQRQISESKDRRINESFRGLWEHSLAVALMARDVAALSGQGDAEAAYVTGLLHDVGKQVLASMLLEAEKAVVGSRNSTRWLDSGAWIDAVKQCHRQIGLALAEKWKLPESVANTIRDCSDYDADDRASVANIVRFANAIAKQKGIYVGPCDLDDANALVVIGRSMLSLDGELVERLSDGLKERVRAQLE